MNEEKWFYIIFSIISLIFLFPKISKLRKGKYRNFPPCPISLPIIGHLYLIKKPAHRTFLNLVNKYGPILFLKFGTRKVLLISSPALVEECLNKNDIIFAYRSSRLVGKYIHYNSSTISTCSYGPRWRNLRRITTLELLSTNKLNMYQNVRQEEIKMLLKYLYENTSKSLSKVELQSKFSELTFSIVMRMLTGKKYFVTEGENLEESKSFYKIIKEIFEISGASNPSDFMPFLEWIDYQGNTKKLQKLQKKSDAFCQSLIEERRNNKRYLLNGEGKAEVMLDKLLILQESDPEFYSDEMIKGLIMTLIFAGTDTSAATLEWAMTLLVNHPQTMKKVKAELDKIVGPERLVEESDCSKLKYLQNIISETFRLYPAVAIFPPHLLSEDCTVGGYHVSKGTTLLVNAYAIHRDPMLWEDPTCFKPERFESLNSSSLAYKLIPFSVGRRACLGGGLANRVVGLTLASLIQCYEWERPSEELIDMAEGSGISMPKAQPLEVLCKARESMIGILGKIN